MLIQLVYTEAPGNKLTVFYKKKELHLLIYWTYLSGFS